MQFPVTAVAGCHGDLLFYFPIVVLCTILIVVDRLAVARLFEESIYE